MESALSIWQRRAGEAWIAGVEAATLARKVEAVRLQPGERVAITAATPVDFVAELLAALIRPGSGQIFLGASGDHRLPAPTAETQVMIATGGTTGAPRYAMHTWATLTAAARGLQAWLGGEPIDSVCFLPLRHVSGLMQVVRSFVSGGILTLADWHAIERGEFPAPARAGAVTSLVPTQLARLLDIPGAGDWLRGFRAVFLGGAPAWPELLERARRARLPLAPCYGMTETAAQVVALRPDEFLAGRSEAGAPLPHARVAIVGEEDGQIMPPGRAGRIRVDGAALFRGYFPAMREAGPWLANDRGVLSVDGYLTVLGRVDGLINTGGEKVDPAEVEAAIRATGLVADVAVIGVPDAEWGEILVAVIAGTGVATAGEIARHARAGLAGHKLPKRWVPVAALPRTEAGKVDRGALRALIVDSRS